jgi:hypothetical protein
MEEWNGTTRDHLEKYHGGGTVSIDLAGIVVSM